MDHSVAPVSVINRLTTGQIKVLQLVAQLRSSKEIGRELGISHHTVDQRIKRIQMLLGVASRSEAARVFMTSKGSGGRNGVWGDLVYQSPELSGQAFSANEAVSPVEWNPAGDGIDTDLREAQAQYFAGEFKRTSNSSWFSVLFEASRSNELTSTARTGIIVLIMVTSLLALSALISLAEGMSRIF